MIADAPRYIALPEMSERTRHVEGGTIGCLTLRSRTANVASSPIERTSEPPACAEVQPCPLPAVIASTSITSPPVSASAPATSRSRSRPVLGGGVGTMNSPIVAAMTPIGTLMKNTHCQPNQLVRTPPSTRPTPAPAAPRAPHTASAAVRLGLRTQW